MAITNAYILHSFDVLTGAHMDHKHFRMKLAEQLIGDYMSRKRAGRPRKHPHPSSTTPFPDVLQEESLRLLQGYSPDVA